MNSQAKFHFKTSRRNLYCCSLLLVFCLLLNCGVHGAKQQQQQAATSEEDGDSIAGTSGTSGAAGGGNGHGGHNGHSGHSSSSSHNRYDKYGHSSLYPSSALSYYGYPTSYPYSYNYNPYPSEPFYERNGKDFSTRSSNNIPMAASSNFGYGMTSPEFGGQMVASSHGHSHSSGGHGWGWPKGGGGYSGSKVDTSAIGLLGLIGLFSLLQNVLLSLTTTTTTTAAGRKKRDVGDNDDDVTQTAPQTDGIHRANEISLMVLPALNVVAHARNGRIPLECTRREVCNANQLLVKELGVQGRTVGSMISSAITKLLKEVDETGSIGKHLSKAGLVGRNGDNCHIIYPICDSLKDGAEPLPMLMQPSHFTQFGIPYKNTNGIHHTTVPRPNTLN